jgi:hypothetical protein
MHASSADRANEALPVPHPESKGNEQWSSPPGPAYGNHAILIPRVLWIRRNAEIAHQ